MNNVTKEEIIEWALYYAEYEDLKIVAKTVYAHYKYTRKKYYPEEDIKAEYISKVFKKAYKQKAKEKRLGVTTHYVKPINLTKKKKKNSGGIKAMNKRIGVYAKQ